MSSSSKLWSALREAQKSCSGVEYDQRGPRGQYVSCDAMIAIARRALHEHGLALVETQSYFTPTIGLTTVETKRGKETRLIGELQTTYVLSHESGEKVEIKRTWPVVADGRMPLDHATAAANSFGFSYLLRGLLMLPRGEEHIDTADRRVPHEPLERARAAKERIDERRAKEPQHRDAKIMRRDESRERAPKREEIGAKPKVFEAFEKLCRPIHKSVTEQLAERGAECPGLPPDSEVKEVIRQTWTPDRPNVIELCLPPATEPIHRDMLRDLHRAAMRIASKEAAHQLWNELGVEMKKNALVTGYQARLFAALIVAEGEK